MGLDLHPATPGERLSGLYGAGEMRAVHTVQRHGGQPPIEGLGLADTVVVQRWIGRLG